ncbi:MAG: SDR family oxidoreductase [Candidatus Omnitrophica bacterium]|nr:SDR family oxidoreductase [Candidatus Omnitrophota bacterium]
MSSESTPKNPSKYSQMFNLSGKNAAVIGGGGYLGSEFCNCLLESGAQVLLADSPHGKGLEVTQRLKKSFSEKIEFIAVDTTDPKSLQALRSRIQTSYSGKLDILINTAVGVGKDNHFGPFESYSWEDWRHVMDVNLGGPFLSIQTLLPVLAKGSSIINIASMYGVVSANPSIYKDSGWNSPCSYAASKGGLIQLTKYLSVHLASKGVRVNAISPGGVFNDHEPEFVKNYSEKTPMNRMLNRDELMGAIVYLSSDASSYVTGQNILVDGGWTAW